VINIEALRHHREAAQVTNRMKDVRRELAHIVCEKPTYLKNQYRAKIARKRVEDEREAAEEHVASMQKRRIWKTPANSPWRAERRSNLILETIYVRLGSEAADSLRSSE
jgi:hypothetical protein